MLTDQKMTKQVNPVAVGMAGMLVGGVMGAAAVALSDKKNREEAARKMTLLKSNVDKWSERMIDQAQKLSSKARQNIEENVTDGKREVDEIVEEIKEKKTIVE